MQQTGRDDNRDMRKQGVEPAWSEDDDEWDEQLKRGHPQVVMYVRKHCAHVPVPYFDGFWKKPLW